MKSFLVCIVMYLSWEFHANVGKCRPESAPYLDNFQAAWGFNTKEIQLNLCQSFSYLMNSVYLSNDSQLRKTRVHSYFYEIPCQRNLFDFLPKTLFWNKITFPASSLLSLAELEVSKLMRSLSEKFYQYFF